MNKYEIDLIVCLKEHINKKEKEKALALLEVVKLSFSEYDKYQEIINKL